MHQWGRGSPVLGPFLGNLWNQMPGGIGHDLDGHPWTLLYTYCQLNVNVSVPSGSTLPRGWWAQAQVRVGLKFSPDGSPPGMATNDLSPDVLAMQNLHITSFAGDPSGSGAYTVSWAQTEGLEIKTRRRNPAHNLAVVYPYVWATDIAGALQGAHGAQVGAPIEVGCLWGR